jgi:hypothetical protein
MGLIRQDRMPRQKERPQREPGPVVSPSVEEGPRARAFQAQLVFLVDASDFAQFFLANFALTLCSQVICEAEGGHST